MSASWQRSLAAHVDPDRRTPRWWSRDDELPDLRAAHPLNEVMPLLRSTLVSIADEAMHVMLVTDAEGIDPVARGRGAGCCTPPTRSASAPGTRWSEEAIGTNAMGTTLAVDAPVQIHSAEHLVRTYHAWTCAAAPVHDPDTGTILGAIDISGPLHTMHPAMVQLGPATAQLAENQLRVRLAIADERLRVRNMPHLTSLRGPAGALVTPSGRIIAGEPYGCWPDRVDLTEGADRVRLADGREMVGRAAGRGLPAAVERVAARPDPAQRAVAAVHGRGLAERRAQRPAASRSPCGPAEVLTALALHPEGSPPSSWRCCSTARTATRPPSAARSTGCAG